MEDYRTEDNDMEASFDDALEEERNKQTGFWFEYLQIPADMSGYDSADLDGDGEDSQDHMHHYGRARGVA